MAIKFNILMTGWLDQLDHGTSTSNSIVSNDLSESFKSIGSTYRLRRS